MLTPEPDRRAEIRVARRLDLVEPGLLDLLYRLAAGEAKWPLYLHGLPGRGKTRAVLAYCDHVMQSWYCTVDRLADMIIDHRAPWQRMEEFSLAVLDEIGVRQRVTDLDYQAVQRFADAREKALLPVIYVSNLTAAELPAAYDDRIASRLLCGTWYELTGPDRRFAT